MKKGRQKKAKNRQRYGLKMLIKQILQLMNYMMRFYMKLSESDHLKSAKS